MSDKTKIEWADSTFNPWEGCTKVGPGCDNCYAENRNARYAGGQSINWGPGAPRRRTSASNWNKPRQWERDAAAFQAEHGRRRRVFCASLADVFDNAVDASWRADLFALIAETPSLDWLLVTKRIGNAQAMIDRAIYDLMHRVAPSAVAAPWPWLNVWLGATIVNQTEADRDIPKLLATPARVRFLSMEPLLGPVDLERPRPGPDMDQGGGSAICQPWLIQSGIDWVIVGGESGSAARPMNLDWARSLRDQCAATGVPFLFKQWGEWAPVEPPPDVPFTTNTVDAIYFSGSRASSIHVGKKKAGRLLDDIEHNGFPA